MRAKTLCFQVVDDVFYNYNLLLKNSLIWLIKIFTIQEWLKCKTFNNVASALSKTMNGPTFSECFCAKNNIAPQDFARVVLKRALYPRARFISGLLLLLDHNHFASDYDLVYAVSNLRRMREFLPEVQRFNEHPGNRGLLRRTLGMRVSTKRLKALIRATLPHTSGEPGQVKAGHDEGSLAPFEQESARVGDFAGTTTASTKL